MTSLSASFKPTGTLESPFTKIFEDPPASTSLGLVIYREFLNQPALQAPPGAIDIDDLAAQIEQSPAGAKAIAKGREWVGKTFYKSGSPSIAKLRLKKGWSQAELARRADTSQPYIARLEQGRVDPQISTVKKLAKALGLPLGSVVEAISPEAVA